MDDIARYWSTLIAPSIITTIVIVFFTVLIGGVLGFILSYFLTLWGPNGLDHKPFRYNIINFFVNIIRSFPILILIVAMVPITRAILGTILGTRAVILPLSIACTAFIAKLFENIFISVDKQLIEAARSFGATNSQIFFRVILKESVPAMISTINVAIVTYIAATTIAGTVGGGGIGAIALTYGYQSFNYTILYMGVLVLLIMVNIVQFVGDKIYNKIK